MYPDSVEASFLSFVVEVFAIMHLEKTLSIIYYCHYI